MDEIKNAILREREERERVAQHWLESRREFPSPEPILEPYDDYDPEESDAL